MNQNEQATRLLALAVARTPNDDGYLIGAPEDRAALFAGVNALKAMFFKKKSSPKVIAEAWAIVDEDGSLVVEPGTCGPQLFMGESADLGANFHACPNEQAIRVHVVEAPE